MSKTNKQLLGERGEILVTKKCPCPKCKSEKSLKRLPQNFKCADIVCDFCDASQNMDNMVCVSLD